jgi:hypothetical protein
VSHRVSDIEERLQSMIDSKTELKIYSSPELRRSTVEQGKPLLVGHVLQGNRGANDLLAVLFPDTGSEQDRVFPCDEREEPGGLVTRKTSRAFRLFLNVVAVSESLGQSFRRLVGG